MRHIQLNESLSMIAASKDGERKLDALFRAHLRLVRKSVGDRKKYLEKNGAIYWSPVKEEFLHILGNKCWYTEVELVGAPLTIDHFRPTVKYWWLAFDPENYRVACPFANSPEHNALHGCAGGKGHNFPLLPESKAATGKSKLKWEKPVILDPCSSTDCELIVFQTDGRPALNPRFSSDAVAKYRLEQSSLLLNLDHPDFNAKRERLYFEILDDVKDYQMPSQDAETKARIKERMIRRISPVAPFSRAAICYLRSHRELDWVEELLDTNS